MQTGASRTPAVTLSPRTEQTETTIYATQPIWTTPVSSSSVRLSTISSAPTPLACVLVLDWSSKGDPLNSAVDNLYQHELTFLNSVASSLFNDTTVEFEAQLGVYGYSPSPDSIIGSLDKNMNNFLNDQNSNLEYGDDPTDLCISLAEINNYQFDVGPPNTCLVIFSVGKRAEQCNPQNSNFGVMITATIQPDGVKFNGTSEVEISSNFDKTDVSNLVNAIKKQTLGL